MSDRRGVIQEEANPIKSVASAVSEAARWSEMGAWNWAERERMPLYNPPFGIWYRGQRESHTLVPSVFREQRDGGLVNETSLYYHFKLRSPKYRNDHLTPFEWLCLMQHYGAPTRLLDWTESVLVGLYFAVELPPGEREDAADGELYVLNAAMLDCESNVAPDAAPTAVVHVPENYNVLLRSVMALYKDPRRVFESREFRALPYTEGTDGPRRDLIRRVSAVRKRHEQDSIEDDPSVLNDVRTFLKRMRAPVAVFPYRTNSRLLTQQGTFTVHGGKAYGHARILNSHETPLHFEDFDEHPFLKRYIIPKGCKGDIRKELNAAGIHKGSLFPELDQQSEYMRALWVQADGSE